MTYLGHCIPSSTEKIEINGSEEKVECLSAIEEPQFKQSRRSSTKKRKFVLAIESRTQKACATTYISNSICAAGSLSQPVRRFRHSRKSTLEESSLHYHGRSQLILKASFNSLYGHKAVYSPLPVQLLDTLATNARRGQAKSFRLGARHRNLSCGDGIHDCAYMTS